MANFEKLRLHISDVRLSLNKVNKYPKKQTVIKHEIKIEGTTGSQAHSCSCNLNFLRKLALKYSFRKF